MYFTMEFIIEIEVWNITGGGRGGEGGTISKIESMSYSKSILLIQIRVHQTLSQFNVLRLSTEHLPIVEMLWNA